MDGEPGLADNIIIHIRHTVPRKAGLSMAIDDIRAERLLTPSEVAALFRVDPKTVTRWAQAGKIQAIRTLGGHRRYRESEVRALLEPAA
jgi:excisionase family DNA binding protein